MARKRGGDRLERRQPAGFVDDGVWRVMVCGPARAGASWICEAIRGLARHAGKWPEPATAPVDDSTVRELIGEAWLELDPGRAWILRAHRDVTDLLFGWRLVVVHRDPRETVQELRRISAAPLPFLIDHVRLAAQLVDTAVTLPGCPVLTVPWSRLCEAPREVLRELAQHLGVTPEAAPIDQLLASLGPPGGRESGSPEPHPEEADPAASEADARAAVEAMLGPWMRRWGYPVERRSVPAPRDAQHLVAGAIAAAPAVTPG